MAKRKNKSKKNKILLISILAVILISAIIFSVVQVLYNQTVDENIYTQYDEGTAGMWMNGYTILTPEQDEEIWFNLTLISPDVSSGQNRPLGELENGVVIHGNPYELKCNWGNSTDDEQDCFVHVKFYHLNVYGGQGDSCDKVWEYCQNGYTCDSGTLTCQSEAECSTNSDCSDGGWTGSPSCNGNDVVQNYITGYCDSNSQCQTSVTQKTKQACDYECDSGECSTPQCSQDSDCSGQSGSKQCVNNDNDLLTTINSGVCQSNVCGIIAVNTTKTCSDGCFNSQCAEDFIHESCNNGDVLLNTVEESKKVCGIDGDLNTPADTGTYSTYGYECSSHTWNRVDLSVDCYGGIEEDVMDCANEEVDNISIPVNYNGVDKNIVFECSGNFNFSIEDIKNAISSGSGGGSGGGAIADLLQDQPQVNPQNVAPKQNSVMDNVIGYIKDKLSWFIIGTTALILGSIFGVYSYLKGKKPKRRKRRK